MTSRDSALLALRPSVQADPDAAASDVEAFLHRTLRPVLKLQNPVLLQLVARDVARRVPDFSRFAVDDQRERLATRLRTDSRLKQGLVGVVYGAFTEAELAFALDHLAEIRRRTLALLTERVLSHVETVSELAES
ncbi:MAG: hypothetical protein Rubg2KO_40690 [Rubricoccaceae bacterium]